MSLDKAIKHGKEKRKAEYHDSRDIDTSCRSHGNCPWCEGKRKYKKKRQMPVEEGK